MKPKSAGAVFVCRERRSSNEVRVSRNEMSDSRNEMLCSRNEMLCSRNEVWIRAMNCGI